MADSRRVKGVVGAFLRRTSDLVPGVSLERRLRRIERQLDRIEYFSNGARATFVGNNRVLVKAVVAGHNLAYLVEADDKLVSPWFIVSGFYEIPLTDFLVRELKPDSRCLDVGANFGYFTCLMARFCPDGTVVAIEADERIRELARDNIAINGLTGNASALHAAAGDGAAEMTLYRRDRRAGNTSIIACSAEFTDHMGERAAEPFVVAGVRVDDLAARTGGRLDFMKIDVEGAEPLVFAGARQAIAGNPGLTIVMEWSPGQIRAAGFDVAAFLAELDGIGLAAADIVDGGVAALSFDELLNLPYRAGIVLRRRIIAAG